MTEVPIRVKITSGEAVKGKEEVVRSLKEIRAAAANTNDKLQEMGPAAKRGAKEASSGLDLLKKAFYTLGGIAIARQILDLGNAFADVRNRVLLVTNSVNEMNQTLDRLFDIANKNRTPIEQLSALYQKASIASKELGASQEDLFKFTELVARGLAIQGGSAATASGALLQLSQSLGSGIVRAEEFNSILEGAFPIAQAAANGLDRAGGSVAKLRQLIASGQVTSKEFFDALLSQAGALEETFAKIQPTIRSAGIVFRNNFIRLMESSQGIFGVIAKGILFLGENLDTLARLAAIAGAALLAAFAPTIILAAITKVTAAITALNIAMLANPALAIATAFIAIATAIAVFSDKISLTNDGLATLADAASVVFSDIGSMLGKIGDYVSTVFEPLITAVEAVFGEIEISLGGIIRFTAKVVDTFIGLFSGAFKAIIAIFGNLPGALQDLFFQALNGTIKIVEDAINKIIGGIDTVLEAVGATGVGKIDLGSLDNNAAGKAGKYGADISEAFKQGFDLPGVEDYVDSVFTRAEEKAKDRLQSVQDSKIDLGKVIQGENDMAGKVGKATDGAKEKFKEVEDTFKSILSATEDALTEFVTTGKFSFSDLVDSILSDLSRLAIQQFVTKPLQQAFGSLAESVSGSLFGKGGLGSLFTFDQGVDYVPRDMMAMVHRGEKIVSANDNRNGTSSSTQSINVNLVMPNVSDYQSFRQNQAQAQAMVAKSLQNSMKRNN